LDWFSKQSALPTEGSGEIERAFYSHEGRLIHKWGHYFEIYERFLSPLRSKETLRLLEIGVSHGGSLQLWRKYFGSRAMIAGVDIDPRAELCEGNTRVFVGSQDDPLTLGRALDWLGGIDVVIDDGSHIVRHQMATLDYLFPQLSESGIYICEDLHTNYWNKAIGIEFEGGYRKKTTFIERMKRAVDDLNEWHHRFGASDKILSGRLFGIHFYDSMVVIEKRSAQRPFHTTVGKPGL
jgi:hypothetical protein